MNLHEYQARDILRRHSIPVPDSEVATTAAAVRAAAERLGGAVVIKAQVHAGGRAARRAASSWPGLRPRRRALRKRSWA